CPRRNYVDRVTVPANGFLELEQTLKRLVSLVRRPCVLGALLGVLASPVAAETLRDLPGALQALPGKTVPVPATANGVSDWQKRWWIEKTARLLRGGDGLGPGDDVTALMQLPEEEIVRRFMAD